MDLHQFINNGPDNYQGDCPWKEFIIMVIFLIIIPFFFFLMNP